MVVGTNPWHSSEHDHIHDNQGDDTPREDDRRRVHRDMVLEGADDEEEEPGDTGSGAAGVDTTNVLNEAGKEDENAEHLVLQATLRVLSVQEGETDEEGLCFS